MTKRMLIDATHPEETRVVVIDGNRLTEFDYESQLRKQLKGNIFLAKVTRVEPSLQAAFVNFGGNRHCFLPFSEIHPDYFRIPVADRDALIAEQKEALEAAIAAEEAALAEEEAALAAEQDGSSTAAQSRTSSLSTEVEEYSPAPPLEEVGGGNPPLSQSSESEEAYEEEGEEEESLQSDLEEEENEEESSEEASERDSAEARPEPRVQHKLVYRGVTEIDPETFEIKALDENDSFGFEHDLAVKIEELARNREDVLRVRLHHRHSTEDGKEIRSVWVALREDNLDIDLEKAIEEETRRGRDGGRGRGRGRFRNRGRGRGNGSGRSSMQNRQVEILGGDGVENDQPFRPSLHRNYKIQEVIKRGQIMLIQVQKEERGNKGAAVTTYLSLPGRYCVLMPNSPRGGGVSRKVASFAERKRMREILSELDVPEGMSVILRTAGVSRNKVEIKRDLDYLMRLWDNIRDLTLQSSAPALIYEESNLVKRSVRDIYASDIEGILVAGEEGYHEAKNFMKLLMPSHVDRVEHYTDEKIPLFHRYQVENQIAEIGESVVNLRSGGYLVINPTEALVSIDVNSGRATKERHIEGTALKTNLEAAEEVARQLRLRDLGGLVVIDFIDMEDFRNDAKVERRLKEALSSDRARIQVGRISSFGLMELSRQRLNPSLTEAQFERCPHCKGVGFIRSVDSATILALRSLEEEGIRNRSSQIILSVPNSVALYVLNQKRDMLADIERRYGFTVFIRVDETLAPTGFKLEAIKGIATQVQGRATRMESDEEGQDDEVDESLSLSEAEPSDEDAESSEKSDGNSRGGRRERGRNRGRGRSGGRGNSNRLDDSSSEEPRNTATEDSSSPAVNAEGDNRPTAERDPKRSGSRGRGRGGPRERSPSRGEGRPFREDTASGEVSTDSPPSAANVVSSNPAPKPEFRAKRFQSRKPSAEETPAAVPSSSSVSVPTTSAPVAASVSAGSPSNDVSEKDASSGGSKKRGWWNRLIEK